MLARARRLPTITAAMSIAMLVPWATAGRHPDIDFDKLKGELRRGHDDWSLSIRYEVDIEDRDCRDRFDLVFYLTERGHSVRDDYGERIEIVVPLDRPTEVDDDELEFEGKLRVRLHPGDIDDPKRVRLHAVVLHEGCDRPLARKDKSVKYKRSKSGHRCRSGCCR